VARDIHKAVREACLWLPEAEEFLAHGSPNFRVRGKTFATYVINHHGDGRVALWLNSPPGSQEMHVRAEPRHFFIPAYVGSRGWLGVILDGGIEWARVAALVREAFEKTAPKDVRAALGKTPPLKAPDKALAAEQIDPFKSARAVSVLTRLREICLSYPESSEGRQFGHPIWAAGKKTFVIARYHDKALTLCFWVGVEAQGMFTADKRFSIPPYMGHNGWIALDVTRHCDWNEVAGLCDQSYRHFALQRMLASMASNAAPNTPE
jgi:hypothetical protein